MCTQNTWGGGEAWRGEESIKAHKIKRNIIYIYDVISCHTLYVVMLWVMSGGCTEGNSFPNDTCCRSSYHCLRGQGVYNASRDTHFWLYLIPSRALLELDVEYRGGVAGILPVTPPGHGRRDSQHPLGERQGHLLYHGVCARGRESVLRFNLLPRVLVCHCFLFFVFFFFMNVLFK